MNKKPVRPHRHIAFRGSDNDAHHFGLLLGGYGISYLFDRAPDCTDVLVQSNTGVIAKMSCAFSKGLEIYKEHENNG